VNCIGYTVDIVSYVNSRLHHFHRSLSDSRNTSDWMEAVDSVNRVPPTPVCHHPLTFLYKRARISINRNNMETCIHFCIFHHPFCWYPILLVQFFSTPAYYAPVFFAVLYKSASCPALSVNPFLLYITPFTVTYLPTITHIMTLVPGA